MLACKMLDQGVDIPQIDHALFIASSRNERQFIQRRGRILRLHDEKPIAKIFDTIALPANTIVDEDSSDDFKGHIKFELLRSLTFANHAVNKGITSKIESIAIEYGVDINDCIINDLDEGYEDIEVEN